MVRGCDIFSVPFFMIKSRFMSVVFNIFFTFSEFMDGFLQNFSHF